MHNGVKYYPPLLSDIVVHLSDLDNRVLHRNGTHVVYMCHRYNGTDRNDK